MDVDVGMAVEVGVEVGVGMTTGSETVDRFVKN